MFTKELWGCKTSCMYVYPTPPLYLLLCAKNGNVRPADRTGGRLMDNEPQVTITMNLTQAKLVMRTLDLYSRLRMGQFNEILFLFWPAHRFDRSRARSIISELRRTVLPELDGNTYHKIYSDTIGDGQEAYDIYQTLRHAIAWHLHPQGGGTLAFDQPRPTSTEPLPTVTVRRP